MASSDLTARLSYLNDSAHLLATTAPTISRYLMSEYNSLMFESGIEQSESHRTKACGACGTIMILGWDGNLEVESQRGRREKSTSRKAATERARAMVYKCESCRRQTRISIPSSSSRHKALPLSEAKHSSSITQASNTSLLPSTRLPQPKSNISSTPSSTGKKRTRARKQGGLEAVLARQSATDSGRSSGYGLGWLDFMKKT